VPLWEILGRDLKVLVKQKNKLYSPTFAYDRREDARALNDHDSGLFVSP
jgi:hypothetical protein